MEVDKEGRASFPFVRVVAIVLCVELAVVVVGSGW